MKKLKDEFPDSVTAEGQYAGRRVFIIRTNSLEHFPFQVTVRKARLILKHLKELKAFAKKSPLIAAALLLSFSEIQIQYPEPHAPLCVEFCQGGK